MKLLRRILLALVLVFAVTTAASSSQTSADYVVENETNDNEFVVGCWESPIIDSSALPGSDYLHNQSWITFSWQEATTTCPIAKLEYRFQVFGQIENASKQVLDTGWGSPSSQTLTDLQDGTYYWQLMVRDQFNNERSTGAVSFIVDTKAPEVTLSLVNTPFEQDGSKYIVYYPSFALFQLLHSDREDVRIEYRLNNGEWQSGTEFRIENEPVTTIEYKATDRAGNSSAVKTASVITDLSAPSSIQWHSVQPGSTKATVSWYAPVDNNPTGLASTYDIRYSLDPITEDSFATASAIAAPVPQGAWTVQSIDLENLNPVTPYYIAIRSFDMAGNRSALAVQAFTTTANPLEADPTLTATVNEQKGEVSFVIDNVAEFDSIEYQITYERSGLADGVQGSIQVDGQTSVSKSGLTLGTCSSGVCVMHTHIQNLIVRVILRKEGSSELLELEQTL